MTKLAVQLSIRLLGAPEVQIAEYSLALNHQKARALLYYLAATGQPRSFLSLPARMVCWERDIRNEQQKWICVSRCTLAVIASDSPGEKKGLSTTPGQVQFQHPDELAAGEHTWPGEPLRDHGA